jgi:hypothetical protein
MTMDFEKKLGAKVKIGTAETMRKFVGQEVDQGPDSITIRQTEYTIKICRQAGIDSSRRVATPSQGGEDPRTLDELQKAISFAEMPVEVMQDIGGLRYDADHTRPDILYATAKALTDITGAKAKRVLQYPQPRNHLPPRP